VGKVVALRERLIGKDWFEQAGIRRDPEVVAGKKVVVAGGGSFGTAMSFVLASNGYPVTMLVSARIVSVGWGALCVGERV